MAKVIERLRKGTSTVQTVLYGRGADARSQTGEYTVTGLTADSAYQIRPYVIEDGTVVYGSALTFRTAPQAIDNGGYSFMALSSSADMRVSMKDYTGNYVSNSQTEASFTYSFTLRSGVTEYGILVGNTGSELKISNSIKREAIPVGLQEVVKIVLPSGDYWEKGSGDETPDASGSPEYVDLGLSVKWAKWNMGASSINEYGGYYGWGDPTGEVVSPYTNKYAVGNTSSSITGNPKYDIATAKWGAGWRLPTKAEFEEMIAASGRSWTYDDSTGVKKYIATFPNGKTLDLPYDGYMNSSKTEKSYSAHLFYWTSEATTADSAQMPYYMHASGPRSFSFVPTEKYMHLMIRPVYDGGGSSGGDTPDTPDIPDPGDDTTGTPALEVRLFGMGSNGVLFNNIDISKTSRYFYGSSAYSAIAHIYGSNTGGIVTTPSTEAQSGVNTWSGLSAIDNYAYMLMRTSGYGGWAGGYAQSGNGQFSFTTVNTPQVTSSITWNCTTDEDNVTLLTGMVCSKAVRVPASGASSYTGVMRFPYEFSSELFFTEVKMFPVTVDSTTHEASYPSDGVSQYTANGITVSLADGDTTLDSVLTYNISRNTTSQYREYMFIICPIQHYTTSTTPRTDWGVTLHFIQEPYNKNRIYYGTGFGAESTYRNYSDEYRNRNSAAEGELYKHHAFFQTANSRILAGSTTMRVRANSYIAYPNVFDYAIDLTGVGSTVLSAAYMWGEQEYTVVKITSDGNIQFN